MSAPSAKRPVSMSFVAYPKFCLCWILIVVGLTCALMNMVGLTFMDERVIGWCWSVALVAVLLAMGLDIDGRSTAVWVAVVFGLTCALIAAATAWDLSFLSWIPKLIEAWDVKMNAQTALGLTAFLGIVFLITVGICHLNQRWVVIPGKISRKRLFGGDEEYALLPGSITYEIPDYMDNILFFLAGELLVKDKAGGAVVKRISLVPFIGSIDRQIDQFETTPTTPTAT